MIDVHRGPGGTTQTNELPLPSRLARLVFSGVDDVFPFILNPAIIAYLSLGVDLSTFTLPGLFATKANFAIIEASQGPVDGEDGLSHWCKSGIFDLVNSLIWDTVAARNARTRGRRYRRRGGTGGSGARTDYELLMEETVRVLFELKLSRTVSSDTVRRMYEWVREGRVHLNSGGQPIIQRIVGREDEELGEIVKLFKQVGLIPNVSLTSPIFPLGSWISYLT